ncbi:hypothetical protein H6P81_021728 [Aristolochia fimbriata]|uniref:Uncharacterized protein n=1 Tax=Aristolochia fimbriata TaxID=158543 RepID=A0AAV7DQ43_ARIFI|nr:hypothetical protein H6P81_021728 [Aristolochia fimbriata]
MVVDRQFYFCGVTAWPGDILGFSRAGTGCLRAGRPTTARLPPSMGWQTHRPSGTGNPSGALLMGAQPAAHGVRGGQVALGPSRGGPHPRGDSQTLFAVATDCGGRGRRAGQAWAGVSLGLLAPSSCSGKACRPSAGALGGTCCPRRRSVQWLCPSACEGAKAILPLASRLGDGLQLFSKQGKGAFCCFAMQTGGQGHRAWLGADARVVLALDILWVVLPSYERAVSAVFPYFARTSRGLVGSLAFLCESIIRRRVPLRRLSLPPGVLRRRDAAVFHGPM